MMVAGQNVRTIALADDGWRVKIVDQTLLPHRFEKAALSTLQDAASAIAEMKVRGAPLIGATAAYGMALAARANSSDTALLAAAKALTETRPTAVNLHWAVEKICTKLAATPRDDRVAFAYKFANKLCEEDVLCNRAIGEYGLNLIKQLAANKPAGATVNILTHCNAGWLATVDWGTALAPVYAARSVGIPCHVWVDETRPRNQGAQLTAWELGNADIPHTVIVDNAGGHLMQTGQVDCCIVGADRTTARGDVCNKIGTYLKALAAHDNKIPFYVALPSSTIDWNCAEPDAIPIETRNAHEVTHVFGKSGDGHLQTVQLTPDNTRAYNPAFDITPASMITALITERGCCEASQTGLLSLFPEHK